MPPFQQVPTNVFDLLSFLSHGLECSVAQTHQEHQIGLSLLGQEQLYFCPKGHNPSSNSPSGKREE